MFETASGERVTTLTLDRPERRNALTREGLGALESALEAVDPAATPVVHLRGAGSAFCAGADLDVVAALDAEGAREFARLGQRVARAIETHDAVVVAGVDGAARGGGVELALACDMRVATPAATFGATGVRLGLFGAWGGTARLPRVVGQGTALDLALSGRVLDAEAARDLGLVSRLVEDRAAVASVAAAVAEHPADALATVKRRVRDDAPTADQEAAEAEAFGRLVAAHGAALGEGGSAKRD